MTDFEIRSAVRVNTPAFIALAGPSGSGKTRSALELATGLAGDGKILLGDTEGNRALHYADLYKFDHVEFRPPYTPERCAELIDLAETRGYAVVVVDSGSDEYEGEGGLQEIRDATNDEFWARTKARHKHALINRIRRARLHVIFCLRCEERVKISKVQGRTVVETLGWMPICEKRFLYEMQTSLRFDPDRPGVPVPIKLYDIHARFFPSDAMITREAGRALAAWAAGGTVPTAAPALTTLILTTAQAEADKGVESFRAWWKTISRYDRRELGSHLEMLQARAEAADEDHPNVWTREEPAAEPVGELAEPPFPEEPEPASPQPAASAAVEAHKIPRPLDNGAISEGEGPQAGSPSALPAEISPPHLNGQHDWRGWHARGFMPAMRACRTKVDLATLNGANEHHITSYNVAFPRLAAGFAADRAKRMEELPDE